LSIGFRESIANRTAIKPSTAKVTYQSYGTEAIIDVSGLCSNSTPPFTIGSCFPNSFFTKIAEMIASGSPSYSFYLSLSSTAITDRAQKPNRINTIYYTDSIKEGEPGLTNMLTNILIL
jgi:hypothetical protein